MMVVVVYVDVMVRVDKVDPHDDRENKHTQSKYHGRHSPALRLL